MKECAEDVHQRATDLPPLADVNACISESFEQPDNTHSDNKLLKADKDTAHELGIFLHPSITINQHTYRGELSGKDIVAATC